MMDVFKKRKHRKDGESTSEHSHRHKHTPSDPSEGPVADPAPAAPVAASPPRETPKPAAVAAAPATSNLDAFGLAPFSAAATAPSSAAGGAGSGAGQPAAQRAEVDMFGADVFKPSAVFDSSSSSTAAPPQPQPQQPAQQPQQPKAQLASQRASTESLPRAQQTQQQQQQQQHSESAEAHARAAPPQERPTAAAAAAERPTSPPRVVQPLPVPPAAPLKSSLESMSPVASPSAQHRVASANPFADDAAAPVVANPFAASSASAAAPAAVAPVPVRPTGPAEAPAVANPFADGVEPPRTPKLRTLASLPPDSAVRVIQGALGIDQLPRAPCVELPGESAVTQRIRSLAERGHRYAGLEVVRAYALASSKRESEFHARAEWLEMRKSGFAFPCRDPEQRATLARMGASFLKPLPSYDLTNFAFAWTGLAHEWVQPLMAGADASLVRNGMFGTGVYASLQAEHAALVHAWESDADAGAEIPLLLSAVVVGLAYPVTRAVDYATPEEFGPWSVSAYHHAAPISPAAVAKAHARDYVELEEELHRSQEKPLHAGCDAHVVSVSVSRKHKFQAAVSAEAEFDELVLRRQSQLLPLAVVFVRRM
eukprot:m51a1_g1325 hypothetical protein (597) ;mRNA; f:263564-265354